MTRPVRLGAVSYLNVRPLVWGLDQRPDRVSVRFDVPSVCADLLERGEIDLGMVPSIAHLARPGDRIVPGVSIRSDGPVASVALFTRVPVRDVRSIALDTSSRTSAALTRILCARRFEIAPSFIPHGPDLSAMLAAADAALLIGDPALFVDPAAHGAEKIDLGQAWTSMTGLPFVWAFWAGRQDAANEELVRLLQAARAEGQRHLDRLADDYVSHAPEYRSLARRYLRDHLAYNLDDRSIEGLQTYYREAAALDLAPEAGPLAFFPASAEEYHR